MENIKIYTTLEGGHDLVGGSGYEQTFVLPAHPISIQSIHYENNALKEKLKAYSRYRVVYMCSSSSGSRPALVSPGD
jgi:hypothetical protein